MSSFLFYIFTCRMILERLFDANIVPFRMEVKKRMAYMADLFQHFNSLMMELVFFFIFSILTPFLFTILINLLRFVSISELSSK